MSRQADSPPRDVNELIDLLRSLRARMAIALVEHHVDMVMAVSDTITVLNLGQVIASGTTDGDSRQQRCRQRVPRAEGCACLRSADLTVAYGGVIALDNVSLSVPEGSITAVLGRERRGQDDAGSHHLRTGQAPQWFGDAGDQQLVGRSPEAIARLGVGHVPEGHGIVSELTVDENLRLGGLWRRDRADQRVAIEEAYELFPPLRVRRSV